MNAFVKIASKSLCKKHIIMLFPYIMYRLISLFCVTLSSLKDRNIMLSYVYSFLFIHKLNVNYVWEVLTYIKRACPGKKIIKQR